MPGRSKSRRAEPLEHAPGALRVLKWWERLLQDQATVTPECAQGVSSMRINGKRLPTRAETTVVALVRDEDRFEAVVAPAPRNAPGTHELRYLWNRKPFISGVFQRSTFDTLLASVKALQDELIGRGWHVVAGNVQGG